MNTYQFTVVVGDAPSDLSEIENQFFESDE